jgi:hypothetical protein
LMRRVGRRLSTETPEAQAWTREEVVRLLALAEEVEASFAPLLHFLFATDRRGEALALKWEDVNLETRQARIRRSITRGAVTTQKSRQGADCRPSQRPRGSPEHSPCQATSGTDPLATPKTDPLSGFLIPQAHWSRGSGGGAPGLLVLAVVRS